MVDQSQFLEAARTGHIEIIREYLDQLEADIECRGYLNQTALLLASWNGRTEVARLLIESGANVHNAWYPAQQTGTALEMAAENGHEDLVNLLLEAGGAVNNPLSGQCPALLGAARAGYLSIVNRLLDAGANALDKTADGTTVLIMISGFGPQQAVDPDSGVLIACLKKILKAGVDVNAADNLSQTAVSAAVGANNDTTVQFLLETGADPDRAASVLPISQWVRYPRCLELLVRAGLDRTLFVRAISEALLNGSRESAGLLAEALPGEIRVLHVAGVDLVKGCLGNDLEAFTAHVRSYRDTEVLTFYGGVALSAVLGWMRHRMEKVRILLDIGAEVNADLGLHTPIVLAARIGEFELLELLIDRGADPNPGSGGDVSPLMIVLGWDRLRDDRTGPSREFDSLVEKKAALLIRAGADVNARTADGLTPLLIALERFPLNIDRLLQSGAELNAADKNGWTPLMRADAKPACRLIEAGADVTRKNKDGRTALFLSPTPAKAEALRRAGADPTERDRFGMTPLMYQAERGNLTMVQWFARYNKNRGALDLQGNNAILHAYGEGVLGIIRFLVDLGEDPRIVNSLGDTFLIRASRMGGLDLVRLALTLTLDINAVNRAGETALSIACRYHDNGFAAEFLIRRGADPFISDPDGRNALDMARMFKPEEGVKAIEKAIRERTMG